VGAAHAEQWRLCFANGPDRLVPSAWLAEINDEREALACPCLTTSLIRRLANQIHHRPLGRSEKDFASGATLWEYSKRLWLRQVLDWSFFRQYWASSRNEAPIRIPTLGSNYRNCANRMLAFRPNSTFYVQRLSQAAPGLALPQRLHQRRTFVDRRIVLLCCEETMALTSTASHPTGA
jgi:hypothetical protein